MTSTLFFVRLSVCSLYKRAILPLQLCHVSGSDVDKIYVEFRARAGELLAGASSLNEIQQRKFNATLV